MLKIYFAGKIIKKENHKNEYRLDLSNEEYYKEHENHTFSVMRDCCILIGALDIGCDHGCFHGNNSHGANYASDDVYNHEINESMYGCSGGDYCKCEHIKKILNVKILKEDILIAVINKEKDCFGTIAEISYAYSLKKPIIVLFKIWIRLWKMKLIKTSGLFAK